jgi:RhoGAP domain
VYFHQAVPTFEKRQINWIKDLYRDLPPKYFLNFKKFLTINLSWVNKWEIELGFGSASRFLRKIVEYYDSVNDFKISSFFEKKWIKFIPDFKQLDKFKSPIPQIQVLGKSLFECSLSDNGLPYLVIAMILYFEEKEDELKSVGIFRKAAGASDLQKLLNRLENGEYEYLFSIKDPIVICDLMKKFFSSLTDPLFPIELNQKFLGFQRLNKSI